MNEHKYDDLTFVADKLVAADTAIWCIINVLYEHLPQTLPTLIQGMDHALSGDKMPSEGARTHLKLLRDAVARHAPTPPDFH